jgi:hypothetical protein
LAKGAEKREKNSKLRLKRTIESPLFCNEAGRRFSRFLSVKIKGLFENLYFFKQTKGSEKRNKFTLFLGKMRRYIIKRRLVKACLKKYTFSNKFFGLKRREKTQVLLGLRFVMPAFTLWAAGKTAPETACLSLETSCR